MVPGALIEDRFEIVRKAGAGGMGDVFRAVDRTDGAPVAIKLLRSEEATEIARFKREATVLAELRHPGIVRYIAHGTTAAGEHYLAMEWLEGEDLRQRFTQRSLTITESLTILRQTATALVAAHGRGVLHRDIKPSNIFLVSGDVERVKLLDFGIARLARDTHRLTRPGLLVGTLGYMAPEQVQGSSVHDPRTDVFALGCVFFECLAARRAFEGSRAMAVLAKILLQEAPPLRSIRPEVPEPVERLVARMLAKDPDERPLDTAEVAAELERLSVDLEGARSAPPESIDLSSVGPISRDPISLTLTEQRLVSVVLAGAPPTEDSAATMVLRTPELEHFGGHLNILTDGSMLVTIWGTGSVVDRARRAARCALALQARFSDVPICVVTGRGVAAARVVEGEVIDRGVRALLATRPDTICLDAATADMLDAHFITEPDGDGFTLHGEQVAPDTAPLLLGKPTGCVGRGRELAMIESVLLSSIADSVASAVLVTGPAGSGKSRIRREFIERIERRGEPVEILSGRADSLGESSSFGIVADAIRRAAGIEDGEPLETRRQKLTQRLGRHLARDKLARVKGFLGELCRIPFAVNEDQALRAARDNAQLMGDSMRAAWEDWLTAECTAQPVLVVMEDLHWGDAATVRLMDATLRNLRDQPLVVLALARPEVHTRFPALWPDRQVQTIRLGPLARKASEQIIHSALGKGADPAVVARVVERADGNPFYLEELIRAVAAGRDEGLPDSVLGTVEARLDAEGSEAKRVLRAASVFGERFSVQGVAALLGGEGHIGEVAAWLEALASRELILPASSPPAAEDAGYLFRHGLVREAAYATLTEADRALGHRLAGEWLEQTGHTEAMTLAEHFSRGGEPARAVRWYVRAAEQALAADDLTAVLERAERGIACGAAGEDLGALRLSEAEAHAWRGELALAEQRAVEATALLEPGSVEWFRASSQAVTAAGKLGNLDQMERLIDLICATPPGEGAATARIICLCFCASYLTFAGRYSPADALIEAMERQEREGASLEAQALEAQALEAQALEAQALEAQALEAQALEARALEAPAAAALAETRAFRASAAGDSGRCLESLTAAREAFEQAGDRRNACSTLANLGFIYAELGDFAGAEEALRAALNTADRMGLHDVSASALHNLGHVLAYRGELDEARRLEQQALEIFQQHGSTRLIGLSRTYLAKIELLAMDPLAAEREARAAAEVLLAIPPLRAAAVAVLARALLAQGRAAEALEAAREAYSVLAALGSLEEGESLVRLVHAEALAANGREPDFLEAITSARDQLLMRAGRISDRALRERFLTTVPDNARTLALAPPAEPVTDPLTEPVAEPVTERRASKTTDAKSC